MENYTRFKGDIVINAIKLIFKIVYQILIFLCLILTIIIVLQKVTNSNKTIFGYRIFRVVSGSMEPAYDIGEVVICKETEPEDIKVGDDIVYLGEYDEYKGKIIMHEVTKIDRDENNNINFHAKGLHSASVEDPRIKSTQIFGVVKFKSDILTTLYKLAMTPYSSFIIITILVLNVFVSFKFTKKEQLQQLNEVNEEFNEEAEENSEEENENSVENDAQEIENEIKDDEEKDL